MRWFNLLISIIIGVGIPLAVLYIPVEIIEYYAGMFALGAVALTTIVVTYGFLNGETNLNE
jgi:hypothetical protein